MWNRLVIMASLLCISARAQTEDKSVIIIGAGLSGYAAARRLIENGITDIKILEALDRTGGRILSVPFSDGFVDLGAQWCHGQTNNIIYEMTSPHFAFGSTPFEDVEPYFRFSNGTMPDQKIYNDLYTAGYEIIHGIDSDATTTLPFGELFMQKFNALLATTTFQNVDPETINFVKAELVKNVRGFFAANSWNDISPRVNYDEEKKAGGDQHCTWKKEGFQTFFKYLTKKAPNPAENLNIDAKVILNKKVSNIQYNKDDATSKVTVSCADGTTYTATHVIVTPSLGYLKANYKTLFTPVLSGKKALEIESRGVGNLGKFFMKFDNVFWPLNGDPYLGIEGMWLEVDRQLAISEGREWLLGVVAVYAVESFPDILEVFLAGDYVATFENTDTEKIIADVTWWLEKFAPYMKPVPRPSAVARTKWMTHEFFLGSYSYPSMGEQLNNVRTSDLAEPIVNTDTKPILLFAGEATDTKWPSMAHGAVNSGFRAGQQIINYYLP